MLSYPHPPISGKTYEHTYLGWVEWLRNLAFAPEPAKVAVPASWAPFCAYLGHFPEALLNWFPEDQFAAAHAWENTDDLRRLVEVMSASRPELAHALYEWDTCWRNERPRPRIDIADRYIRPASHSILVTCNGSFFRPEFMQYLEGLKSFDLPSGVEMRRLVICPCAADKPYPAPLHTAIKEAVPDAYLIIATGVLGMIPEDLWATCPSYDSGIPNQVRVYEETKALFSRVPKRRRAVVIYSDFYGPWIARALRDAGQSYKKVFSLDDISYRDLRSEENLFLLKEACR